MIVTLDAEEDFHRLYNLGNDRPEELMTLVSLLEDALGKTAEKVMKPMQPGDVERTWADIAPRPSGAMVFAICYAGGRN